MDQPPFPITPSPTGKAAVNQASHAGPPRYEDVDLPGTPCPSAGVLIPAPEPGSGSCSKFVRTDSVPQYVLPIRPVGLRPARSHEP